MFVIQKKPSENKTLMPEEKPATKKRLSVKVIKIITIPINTNIINTLYKTFIFRRKKTLLSLNSLRKRCDQRYLTYVECSVIYCFKQL